MINEYFQLKDKNLVYVPFHEITDGVLSGDNSLNYFHLNKKKTYCNNSDLIVKTCNEVINANPDLMSNYLAIRFQIKLNPNMEVDEFVNLLYDNLIDEAEDTISDIVEKNYKLNLDKEIESKRIKNTSSSLIYRDVHCKILLKICYMTRFTIPLSMEFAYNKLGKKENANNYILTVYNRLYGFDYFQKNLETKININNKLTESIKSRIIITKYSDKTFWNYIENMGKNTNNFIYEQVKKFKTDIIVKFVIERSVINYTLAFASNAIDQFIRTNFPVTFKSCDMSAKGEEEETNKFESIEINSARINEDLNIVNKVIIDSVIKQTKSNNQIKISSKEFAYYKKNLRINELQTNLVSLFFAEQLGACNTIYICENNQYLLLLILMKKILMQRGCKYIPQILTGFVDTGIREKKIISKKYLVKLLEDERYKKIMDKKYKTAQSLIQEKLIVEKIISTLLANVFYVVNYNEEITEIEVNKMDLLDEIVKFLEMI